MSVSPPDVTRCTRSGSATIFPTECRGLSDANGSWNTICIRRRIGCISESESVVMSCPSKMILPDVGRYSLNMARPTVDLPHPDSPTRPRVSPRRMVKVTPSTAFTSPTWRSSSTPLLMGNQTRSSSSSTSASPFTLPWASTASPGVTQRLRAADAATHLPARGGSTLRAAPCRAARAEAAAGRRHPSAAGSEERTGTTPAR